MEKLEIKAAFTVDDSGAVEGVAWPFGSADRTGDTITPDPSNLQSLCRRHHNAKTAAETRAKRA